MQVLRVQTQDEPTIEQQIVDAAVQGRAAPLLFDGRGVESIATVLRAIEHSGMPCVIEDRSGMAAGFVRGDATDHDQLAPDGEWQLIVYVGTRNAHHSVRAADDGGVVVTETKTGVRELYFFGAASTARV